MVTSAAVSPAGTSPPRSPPPCHCHRCCRYCRSHRRAVTAIPAAAAAAITATTAAAAAAATVAAFLCCLVLLLLGLSIRPERNRRHIVVHVEFGAVRIVDHLQRLDVIGGQANKVGGARLDRAKHGIRRLWERQTDRCALLNDDPFTLGAVSVAVPECCPASGD